MTYHKLSLQQLAADGIARLIGQAKAFAAKDEIDAGPEEIEALRGYLVGALARWKNAPETERLYQSTIETG